MKVIIKKVAWEDLLTDPMALICGDKLILESQNVNKQDTKMYKISCVGETESYAYVFETEYDPVGGKVIGLMRQVAPKNAVCVVDYFQESIEEFVDIIANNLFPAFGGFKTSDICPENGDLCAYSIDLYFRHPERKMCLYIGSCSGWADPKDEDYFYRSEVVRE
jgi:hypothetical protein